MLGIIKLDEEEEETVKASGQIPYNPWVEDWISNFDVTLFQGFCPGLLTDALITSVVTAMKGPLNSTRVAGKVGLIEEFERSLASTLEFLYVREDVKTIDPAIKAQQLIQSYPAIVGPKHECLKQQMVAETAHINELAAAISNFKSSSQKLTQECD